MSTTCMLMMRKSSLTVSLTVTVRRYSCLPEVARSWSSGLVVIRRLGEGEGGRESGVVGRGERGEVVEGEVEGGRERGGGGG